MLYPVNINLDDLEVTVIGGGKVALRKCMNFIAFGKKVNVISSEFINEFDNIKENVNLIIDDYKEEYIKHSFIVIAATNNKEVNKSIGLYCRSNGKLVNVVDDIKLSNFTVPSNVKRGDLLISISTGGKSPSLSSKIKKQIENTYDSSYKEYINLLGDIRSKVIEKVDDINKRKEILNSLIDLSIIELKEEYRKYF